MNLQVTDIYVTQQDTSYIVAAAYYYNDDQYPTTINTRISPHMATFNAAIDYMDMLSNKPVRIIHTLIGIHQ